MYMCGEVLRNPGIEENDIISEYFEGAYGDEWKKAYDYLNTLSDLFQPDLVRERDIAADEEMYVQRHTKILLPYMFNEDAYVKFSKIEKVINDFSDVIEKNISNNTNPCRKLSWEILKMHAAISLQYAEGLCAGASGDMIKAQEICKNLMDYLAKHEDEYLPHLDFGLIIRRIKVTFGFTGNIFESIK